VIWRTGLGFWEEEISGVVEHLVRIGHDKQYQPSDNLG